MLFTSLNYNSGESTLGPKGIGKPILLDIRYHEHAEREDAAILADNKSKESG
jgi:hypothetical protein